MDEILLDVMTTSEKVGRLARALGTLRYAVEGGDAALEAGDIERHGAHRPAGGGQFRVAELLAAARERGERGRALSELYVERCYKLVAGDYEQVADLDRRIAELKPPH